MKTYRIFYYQTINFAQDIVAESEAAAIAIFTSDDFVPDENDGMEDGYEIAHVTVVS